ncbi:hypothetical protein [Streptomyces sp. NPDC087294]|uniref:hypothetical protein n=1 Tax=Streptomyces sp. NPDC087294 TaxID=3365777 RepID=UPI0038144179
MEVPEVARRGRGWALVAGAVVLGVVAGGCVGYLVQAGRAPSALPSLSQPTFAAATGTAPTPVAAATDRDLRALLLKKPAGAEGADWISGDGWMDLADAAAAHNGPKEAFSELVGEEFRRTAAVGWLSGERVVEIRLSQFRHEESFAAADVVESNQYGADRESGTDSWPIPGTGTGMVYAATKPTVEAGYLPQYSAQAHAYRGDVVLGIWVYDSAPITKAAIMDLAKRQMEQL